MRCFFERPFSVGDWLEVNGVVGEVIDINWRAVRLLTLEREMVVIPHKLISSEMIRNFTKPTLNHAERIQIGFPNNDPLNLARQVLKTTAMETKGILLNPEPDVFTLGYSDFAITYEVKLFIRNYGEIEQIRERFPSRSAPSITTTGPPANRNGWSLSSMKVCRPFLPLFL